jgi:hypothetical protein
VRLAYVKWYYAKRIKERNMEVISYLLVRLASVNWDANKINSIFCTQGAVFHLPLLYGRKI